MADPSRRARANRDRAGQQRRRQGAPRRGQPSPRYPWTGTNRQRRGRPLPQLVTIAVVILVVMALGPLGVLGGALGGLADPGGTEAPPTPTPVVRPPAPILPGPVERVTGDRRWDLEGRLPAAIAEAAGYSVRVYVDGTRSRQRALAAGSDTFRVPDVPLHVGWNEVTAAIHGPGGEGPRSTALRVLLDKRPPPLEIRLPESESTVNARHVVVRGRTQPGSSVEVRNERTHESASGEARGGAFAIRVRLGRAWNRLVVTSVDPGGNQTVERLRVRRGNGKPEAALSISTTVVPLDTLPRTLRLRVDVRDRDGKPIDDAHVTFSLSPPGLPTATYEARTKDGLATWPEVTIPRQGAVAGDGFATVLVQLEVGATLRDTVRFRFV